MNAMNTGPDLEASQVFDDTTQSVLAYCRTGTRCANLWVATRMKLSGQVGQRRAGYRLRFKHGGAMIVATRRLSSLRALS